MPTTRSAAREKARDPSKLPREIFQHIISFLGPRSVRALYATSTACRDACEQQRHGFIHINVNGMSEHVIQEIAEWEAVLPRRELVQTLKVSGRIGIRGQARYLPRLNYETLNRVDDSDDYTDPLALPKCPIPFEDPRFRGRNQHREGERAAGWRPLAAWIAQLPSLTDIVWASDNQISLEILSAIHQHPRRPRLHMHSFALSSLLRETTDSAPIDAIDTTIITSPCLYSIYASYRSSSRRLDRGPGGPGYLVDNYVEWMIARMIAGLAPRLAHVNINHMDWGGDIEEMDWDGRQRMMSRHFETFVPEANDAAARRSLQSLVLSSSPGGSPLNVILYTLRINGTMFRNLRKLTLNRWVGVKTLETLAEMGAEELPALEALSMELHSTGPADDLAVQDSVAAEAIRSLPLLEELTLSGFIGDVLLSAIVDRGSKVQRLSLFPVESRKERSGPLSKNVLIGLRNKEVAARFPHVRNLIFVLGSPDDDNDP